MITAGYNERLQALYHTENLNHIQADIENYYDSDTHYEYVCAGGRLLDVLDWHRLCQIMQTDPKDIKKKDETC